MNEDELLERLKTEPTIVFEGDTLEEGKMLCDLLTGKHDEPGTGVKIPDCMTRVTVHTPDGFCSWWKWE